MDEPLPSFPQWVGLEWTTDPGYASQNSFPGNLELNLAIEISSLCGPMQRSRSPRPVLSNPVPPSVTPHLWGQGPPSVGRDLDMSCSTEMAGPHGQIRWISLNSWIQEAPFCTKGMWCTSCCQQKDLYRQQSNRGQTFVVPETRTSVGSLQWLPTICGPGWDLPRGSQPCWLRYSELL